MPMDSVDKIITAYFSAVTTQEFTYKKKTYKPFPLTVSPQIFRGFVCVEGCGGCCRTFSLDYLPKEETPYEFETRHIDFNGKQIPVQSDLQKDTDGYYCKHLSPKNGYCGIHLKHPFSCDFELLRFYISQSEIPSKRHRNRLSHALFGRGWQMRRIDGERGAKCYMTEVDKKEIPDLVRKMKRLKDWTDHFKLKTIIPDIISWLKSGPHEEALYLNQEFIQDDVRERPISLPQLESPPRERL